MVFRSTQVYGTKANKPKIRFMYSRCIFLAVRGVEFEVAARAKALYSLLAQPDSFHKNLPNIYCGNM